MKNSTDTDDNNVGVDDENGFPSALPVLFPNALNIKS